MEILARLESRIEEMLTKIRGLENENAELKRRMEESIGTLENENLRLMEELENERAGKEAVVERIDSLLRKLTEHEE